MEKYNLDEKGGLFKFSAKSPQKLVKSDDEIELKHFSMYAYVKARITEVTDTSLRIQSSDKTPDANISKEDHVALYYTQKDSYVITGVIENIHNTDPLDLTVKVIKIEKLKDLVKEKKHCVGINASFKIIGIPEAKPAPLKNISFGGIKVDCREDIMLEDVVDVTVYADKSNKMNFKGKIVRKNAVGSSFEYGLEYTELTESSSKLLTRIMYDIDSRI